MKSTKEQRAQWREAIGVGRMAVDSSAVVLMLADLDDADRQVGNLSMLIRRIAGYRGTVLQDRLIQDAVDYLVREGLQGSPLRDAAAEHETGDWDTEHECDRPDCRRCGRYEP